MQTTVEGAGTLTFEWKVLCEDNPDSVENDPYSYTWDYLELAVDESVLCRIDGDSGWQKVEKGQEADFNFFKVTVEMP